MPIHRVYGLFQPRLRRTCAILYARSIGNYIDNSLLLLAGSCRDFWGPARGLKKKAEMTVIFYRRVKKEGLNAEAVELKKVIILNFFIRDTFSALMCDVRAIQIRYHIAPWRHFFGVKFTRDLNMYEDVCDVCKPFNWPTKSQPFHSFHVDFLLHRAASRTRHTKKSSFASLISGIHV